MVLSRQPKATSSEVVLREESRHGRLGETDLGGGSVRRYGVTRGRVTSS